MNKFKHTEYEPSLDMIFGRLLYKGLIEEAEKFMKESSIQKGAKMPIVTEFLADKETYKLALKMAESEFFEKF